jgi:hypothetical protein
MIIEILISLGIAILIVLAVILGTLAICFSVLMAMRIFGFDDPFSYFVVVMVAILTLALATAIFMSRTGAT